MFIARKTNIPTNVIVNDLKLAPNIWNVTLSDKKYLYNANLEAVGFTNWLYSRKFKNVKRTFNKNYCLTDAGYCYALVCRGLITLDQFIAQLDKSPEYRFLQLILEPVDKRYVGKNDFKWVQGYIGCVFTLDSWSKGDFEYGTKDNFTTIGRLIDSSVYFYRKLGTGFASLDIQDTKPTVESIPVNNKSIWLISASNPVTSKSSVKKVEQEKVKRILEFEK